MDRNRLLQQLGCHTPAMFEAGHRAVRRALIAREVRAVQSELVETT